MMSAVTCANLWLSLNTELNIELYKDSSVLFPKQSLLVMSHCSDPIIKSPFHIKS